MQSPFFVSLIYQQAGLPLFAIDFHAAIYHSTGMGALEHALHHSAVLICQTDDNGLTAGGYMTEGQRPHVAGNDALFLFGDAEHTLCIDAGTARVREAVHLKQPAQAVEGALVMPVIQIKIMQQGPTASEVSSACRCRRRLSQKLTSATFLQCW